MSYMLKLDVVRSTVRLERTRSAVERLGRMQWPMKIICCKCVVGDLSICGL